MSIKASASGRSWPARILGFIRFSACFLRELVLANLQMAKVVLFRKVEDLSPGFLDYPIDGLTKFELIVLSHCITLTPGTTSVEISDDRKILVIHALDAGDAPATCRSIKQGLEEPLLAWTR